MQHPGSSKGAGGVIITLKPEGTRRESHYYNPKEKVMTLKGEVTFGLELQLFLCTPRKKTGKISFNHHFLHPLDFSPFFCDSQIQM